MTTTALSQVKPPRDGLLYDSQWVNIVNHDNAYRGWDVEEAVNHAVKATLAAVKSNIESALASAEPVAWYAPSIDDTCTAAKKAQRERDLPELARLFAVPLHTHPSPAHAGAGAEALAEETAIRCGARVDRARGTYTLTGEQLRAVARRLAGGDHA